jgi:uncharacterized protein (TIGR03000 family)
MRRHMKGAWAIAAVAVLGAGIGVAPAHAEDYPGHYDPAAGQYYSQERRAYNHWVNPNGSMSWVSPSPGYFPGAYTPGTSDYSYGTFAPQKDCANIRVVLPRADAKVWFDDSATGQTGLNRQFVSPKLNPNEGYSYTVKAQWEENGKLVTRTRRVSVSANSVVSVDFTR